MVKNLLSLLEEVSEELQEALPQPPEKNSPKPSVDTKEDGSDIEDDDEDIEDETSSKDLPEGKGHYTADDLREIIDYVKDVIEKEKEEKEDGDDEDKDDDVGEVGLDLLYEYADLLPETVINQIVDDLKDTFEIEDTMLEAIIAEGSAFFSKSRKGPAAKAASKVMRAMYRKNKTIIKKRNKKWRTSPIAQKMIALHKKAFSGLGKIHGKRVVHQI
jgi:hypothetical protein